MGDRVKDKVAIVTGAGSLGPGWGNGKAAAVLYAREGAKIFAVDNNLSAAKETESIIAGEGSECIVYEADVSNSSQVKAAVEHCLEHYGRIDILHNNVGIIAAGGPVELDEEDWDRVCDVNTKSVYLTCKHVLPYMESAGSGSIINISSVAAIRYTGVPFLPYAASKAAVHALTRTVALQYADKGIRCNTILPGVMRTPMMDIAVVGAFANDETGSDIEDIYRARSEKLPMKRLGDAWDTAYAALFLASDEAKYVTGIELIVDGGFTCKSG